MTNLIKHAEQVSKLVVEAAAVAYIFDLDADHDLWKALAPFRMTKAKMLERHNEIDESLFQKP